MKKDVYRIVVLGDSGAGKTAFVKRFVRNEVSFNYDPTIEDKYKSKLRYNDRNVVLEIVDTAGRELLPDMLARYIAFADAFLVCYSVGSRRTFEHTMHLFSQIARARPISQIARVLVGCKCDADYREVSADEANELSAQLQCSFAETSAFHNLNVREVFEECISQLNYIALLRQNPMPGQNSTQFGPLTADRRPPSRLERHFSRRPEDQWYPPAKGNSFCCFL